MLVWQARANASRKALKEFWKCKTEEGDIQSPDRYKGFVNPYNTWAMAVYHKFALFTFKVHSARQQKLGLDYSVVQHPWIAQGELEEGQVYRRASIPPRTCTVLRFMSCRIAL